MVYVPFLCGFRYLNSQTQDFRYAIPDVQELTESFTQKTPNHISSIDLSSGFFQMKISSQASKFTAFNTCFGSYKFLRLPQGLKTSLNSFQMLMDKVLSGLSFRSTLCYLDNVLIFSETFDQHLSDLQEVFKRFHTAGLKLSPGKCRFAQESCLFLGHEISKNGISPPSDRLEAVSEYPVPKTTKQLKRYLGLMNWFKKYIPGYSAKAHCMYQLLRKGIKFVWKDEHKAAFDILFHFRVAKSLRSNNMNQYQLVVPEIMIKTVLGLYHDSPMGGHSGIQDTLDRVKEHYFFPRMSQLLTDYVRSCTDCQKRKQTKVHTKSGVTAYKTPSGPFEVWQIELYGNLPITPQGYTYILTATDMFSKYLVTIPLANKDTLSVASGLTQLFTKYGVCNTLRSDRGVENVSKVMAEVCRQLCIPQELSPVFVHKCLGEVERVHSTMAERLTPYMNSKLNNWKDVLPCITFSINQSVHSGSKYSPHEIIFGQRPKFPLSPVTPPDFDTIPLDMRTYVRKHAESLNIIRSEIKNNILTSQQKTIERVNKNSNPLHVKDGDYVFLTVERTGVGQKIQNNFQGPFLIHRCVSPHM